MSGSRKTKAAVLPPIDVGIITIKEEEFTAALDAFPDAPQVVIGPTSQRHYNLRSADAGKGLRYRIAILRQAEQGNGEAQKAARDLVEELKPSLVLLVGIAGGVPRDDVTLGDVVLSLRVHDYTVSAQKQGSTPEYAIGGGAIATQIEYGVVNLPARRQDLGDWTSTLPTRPPLVIEEHTLYGPDDWKRRVKESLERATPKDRPLQPRFASGVLGSSDALIKDADLLLTWLETARNLLAVEMESAGVYRAIRDRCAMLAIRGISDIIGHRRDERWTAYACATAAAFARAYLRTTPITPRSTPIRTRRPQQARQEQRPGPNDLRVRIRVQQLHTCNMQSGREGRESRVILLEVQVVADTVVPRLLDNCVARLTLKNRPQGHYSQFRFQKQENFGWVFQESGATASSKLGAGFTLERGDERHLFSAVFHLRSPFDGPFILEIDRGCGGAMGNPLEIVASPERLDALEKGLPWGENVPDQVARVRALFGIPPSDESVII